MLPAVCPRLSDGSACEDFLGLARIASYVDALALPALDLAFAEIGNHDHSNVSWTLDLFQPLNSRRQLAHSLFSVRRRANRIPASARPRRANVSGSETG